jgi:hypothetical protein
MKVTDVILDSNNDLLIKDGDFVFDESDLDHIQDIITSEPGEWKQWPEVGVGLKNYLNADSSITETGSLRRKILMQLEADGYRVDKLTISDFEDIQIDAERVK